MSVNREIRALRYVAAFAYRLLRNTNSWWIASQQAIELYQTLLALEEHDRLAVPSLPGDTSYTLRKTDALDRYTR